MNARTTFSDNTKKTFSRPLLGIMISLSLSSSLYAAQAETMVVSADGGSGVEAESAWGPAPTVAAKRSATGTKTDTPIEKNPQSISVVTREEMEMRNVTSVKGAFNYTPGVLTGNRGSSDVIDALSIRGFSETNTNQYLDGLKLQGDNYSEFAIDPYFLERAELLRGPVSVQRGLKDLETAMVVVDRFSGEVRAMVGGADPQYAGYNRALQARRSIGSLAKPATYLTALSQPNSYRLNSWIADEPIALKQPNGSIWKPMNDDRRFSGKVMLVDALTNSMNVPTVNLGMTLGLDAVVDTWNKLGVPKEQLHPVPSMLLGALNLTPVEVAQAFQSIASGGNRASLSAVRSVIAEDGSVLYQSYPQAQRVEPAQAAYLTLYTMQQVADHGTARALGARFPNAHLAGKTGTTNDLVDSWFAGIDGKEVAITWVGRDNNQPTKLYGASGAMQLYRRYLDIQAPMPLQLTPPEDVSLMNVDSAGNFVCGTGSSTWRSLPVWALDPNALCQQQQQQVQQQQQLFDQQQQQQQQQQPQQPAQQQQEQKDSDGVAGWIKDMFGK